MMLNLKLSMKKKYLIGKGIHSKDKKNKKQRIPNFYN